MIYFYFDTSGLAKRYINEIGSAWVKHICSFATGNVVFVSEITSVEITSAITRRSRSGTLNIADAAAALDRFEADLLNEYISLEATSACFAEARSLVKKYGLRGYDAVQLAVALSLNLSQVQTGLPVVTFVSADNELLDAAKSEGLTVENPHNY
ncbi:MAG: type II toxin-antitoxin system VapC family toxin [Pyrinomonadaceae bacterium]